MRFGLVVRTSGADAVRSIREVPRLAEDLGFDSVWLSDHLVVSAEFADRYGAPWLEAVTAATAIAASTPRLTIGFSALVLPYRPAALVARQLATLWELAGGRVVVAVASGHLREEFDALGIPFGERTARTEAGIDAIREACPDLPLLAAGNGPTILRRSIERCDGWHPIARSPEEIARALAAERPGRTVLRARFHLRDAAADRPLYGPGEKVAGDLRAYEDAGVDELVLDYGARQPDDVRDQIQRFASEVRT
jgi:alkanesulfonate monooxygenase SsuD/methylene tetrahydromethanopterin reductase-like flavin-dependent oxidoreductase (luciferase family)